MNELTGEQLLVLWLKENKNRIFTERELQIELHDWQQQFKKYYLPNSLDRFFRFVRIKKLLGKDGLEIIEVCRGKYKSWKVQKIVGELELF